MLRHSAVRGLRYLAAVQAKQPDAVEAVFEDMIRDNILSGRDKAKARYESAFSTTKASPEAIADVTTRLGGARVIAQTRQNFFKPVENPENPIHFVSTTPRQAGLCAPLCRELRRLNITNLTELQSALIPLVLKGRHVVAHSETGSGKSFGVALAVANRISRDVVAHRLHTVILVPTNELALQYDRWLKHFAGAARHIVFAASETIPLEEQLARLHNFQPHVLVGTPQAVALIYRHSSALFGSKLRQRIDTIILDEADVVMNAPVDLVSDRASGQRRVHETAEGEHAPLQDLEAVAAGDPAARPTRMERKLARVHNGADLVDRLYRSNNDELPAHLVALSATIDGPTAKVLNTWTANDEVVRLTTSVVEHSIPDSISFYFMPSSREIPAPACLENALRLIRAQHGGDNFKVLILANDAFDEITSVLQSLNDDYGASDESAKPFRYGMVTAENDLGGDAAKASQVGRSLRRGVRDIFAINEGTVSRLTRGVLNIGVGRFETARGLHINGITHVILYGEVPNINDFVHGAGRTGRNGIDGEVISIFPPSAGRSAQNVATVLGIPWAANRARDVQRLLSAEEQRDQRRSEMDHDHLRAAAVEAVATSSSMLGQAVPKHRLLELRSSASATGSSTAEQIDVAGHQLPKQARAASVFAQVGEEFREQAHEGDNSPFAALDSSLDADDLFADLEG